VSARPSAAYLSTLRRIICRTSVNTSAPPFALSRSWVPAELFLCGVKCRCADILTKLRDDDDDGTAARKRPLDT